MREEGNRPEGRAWDRVAGREAGVHGAAGGRRAHSAVPSFQDALTAALHRRVAQRAARDRDTHPPLVGYLCERCLDAPALLVQPDPWGGEMGGWPVAESGLRMSLRTYTYCISRRNFFGGK